MKIKIHQYLQDGKYYYSIFYDNFRAHNVENKTPATFYNMMLNVCGFGRCRDTMNVKIKNMKLTMVTDCKYDNYTIILQKSDAKYKVLAQFYSDI
jgi:hypothetical protein